jgi:hypothetical protein
VLGVKIRSSIDLPGLVITTTAPSGTKYIANDRVVRSGRPSVLQSQTQRKFDAGTLFSKLFPVTTGLPLVSASYLTSSWSVLLSAAGKGIGLRGR